MSYDTWKSTDPRDYEPEEETVEEVLDRELREANIEILRLRQRIANQQAALREAKDHFQRIVDFQPYHGDSPSMQYAAFAGNARGCALSGLIMIKPPVAAIVADQDVPF